MALTLHKLSLLKAPLRYKELWTLWKVLQTQKVKIKLNRAEYNLTPTSRSAAGFVHSRVYAFNVLLLFGGGVEEWQGGGEEELGRSGVQWMKATYQ